MRAWGVRIRMPPPQLAAQSALLGARSPARRRLPSSNRLTHFFWDKRPFTSASEFRFAMSGQPLVANHASLNAFPYFSHTLCPLLSLLFPPLGQPLPLSPLLASSYEAQGGGGWGITLTTRQITSNEEMHLERANRQWSTLDCEPCRGRSQLS